MIQGNWEWVDSHVETARFVARRGTDGSVISEIDLDPDGYWTLGDTTGDGRAELITLEDVRTPERPGIVDQTVRVWSIMNASILWQAHFQGVNVGGVLLVGSSRNIVFGIFVQQDVSGDGSPDVLVHLRDIEGAFLVGVVLVPGSFRSVGAGIHHGISLDGTDGSEVARLTTTGLHGHLTMFPMPDATGDGLAEIGTITSYGDPLNPSDPTLAATVLSVYPAAGGSAYWEADTGSPRGGRAEPYAMRTSDTSDLVFSGAEFEGDERIDFTRGYSGIDGSILWELNGVQGVDAAGDIDGDGGQDFVTTSGRGTQEDSHRAAAFSGADGSVLWEQSIAAPSGMHWSVDFRGCEGDLNADGICDFLEVVRQGHLEGNTFVVDVVTSRGISGATGEPFWLNELTEEDPPLPRGVEGTADLTGNGTDDLYTRFESGTVDEAREVKFVLSEGTTNTAEWAIVAAASGDESVHRPVGTDLLGDGAPEVVLVIRDHGENIHLYRFQVHDRSGMLYEVVIID